MERGEVRLRLLLLGRGGFCLGRLLRSDERILLLIGAVGFRLLLRRLFLHGFRRSIAHGEYLSLSCLTFGMFVSPTAFVTILPSVRTKRA